MNLVVVGQSAQVRVTLELLAFETDLHAQSSAVEAKWG
jgi:hypothetical protein